MEHLDENQLLKIIFSDCDSDSEEDILAKIIFNSDGETENRETDSDIPKKKRKYWVRPYYAERDQSGAFQSVFSSLKLSDPELFYNYMRMTSDQFDDLLHQVGPLITKEDYVRKSIEPSARLAMTLRYLATGESQKSLSIAYKCSPASIHFIIRETTHAIINVLKSKVFPKISEETFLHIANGFGERWNFPHCLGAIDGKHITIQAASNSGSTFYNYKKFYSVVLLAICDENYNFTMCDIGAAGRQREGIFRNSEFGKKFFSNTLPIPPPSDLSQSIKNMPYVFVADDAFGLHINLMKPYATTPLNATQKIFNFRLSRARRMIENCFGILVSKWRIFRQPIIANIDTVENIIAASVCLHNWLRQQKSSTKPDISSGLVYMENGDGTIIEGSWRKDKANNIPGMRTKEFNSTNEAKEVRNKFADYFTGDGAVPWQMEKI